MCLNYMFQMDGLALVLYKYIFSLLKCLVDRLDTNKSGLEMYAYLSQLIVQVLFLTWML